jgi:thiamine phosphate synthase YjbQ (UPF0047 family)
VILGILVIGTAAAFISWIAVTCSSETRHSQPIPALTELKNGTIVIHNAQPHVKRQVIGRELAVAIIEGRLDLGPMERVF